MGYVTSSIVDACLRSAYEVHKSTPFLYQELRRFALAFIHSHSGATGVFAMLLWKFVAEATSCFQKTLQTT